MRAHVGGCTVAIVSRLRSNLLLPPRQDLLLILVLAGLGQAEVWLLNAGTAPRGLASAAGLVMTLPLAVRRRRPLLAAGAAVAGFAVVFAATDLSSGDDAYVPLVVMLVATYTAGAYPRGPAVLAGAACALAFPVILTVTDPDGFSVGGFLFFALIGLPPYLAGVAIARRRRREQTLERHAADLEAQRETAVANERARIARELHDVVAHGVSVMVVQAQGGARMVRLEPDEAEDAFAAIERTGRQALVEMRRLLGMLRAADERATLTPHPGLERIGDLIDDVRRAGLPVDLRVEGTPGALPPGVDVSAYRIVQEALTNALKHAGPARAQVRMRYLSGAVELEISDDGAGQGASPGTGGHGLIGMQERVAVYGGRLDAGAGPSGGYLIRARLPFEPAGR
jgi:signal transduction histidine kinase